MYDLHTTSEDFRLIYLSLSFSDEVMWKNDFHLFVHSESNWRKFQKTSRLTTEGLNEHLRS